MITTIFGRSFLPSILNISDPLLQGHYRRLDVMLVPPRCLPWAMLGWTGSKQYLRFLKSTVHKCRNMRLNSHGLVRGKDKDEKWGLEQGKRVPEEAPPVDSQSQEFWPKGWEQRPVKQVTCEADIFELLGLPFREPCERNCP